MSLRLVDRTKWSPDEVERLRIDLGDGRALTQRELSVLRSMSHGLTNRQISRELWLSEDTVKTHARHLFMKLGARDRAHAVAIGIRSGLIS